MTNFKDLSFFWANCHYLKPCLSFFRENDLATLSLRYARRQLSAVATVMGRGAARAHAPTGPSADACFTPVRGESVSDPRGTCNATIMHV